MPPFQFLLALALASPESFAESLARGGASDIRVHSVQLDADAPMEAVVQYEMPDTGVHAVVLDPAEGGWREAGRFNSWWSFVKEDARRFLTFRSTVDPAIQDVIVRTRSGGTEEARTTLEVYRLRDGAMVNVLTAVEYLSAMEHPSGDVYTTAAEAAFFPGRVLVRSVRHPGGDRNCRRYVWSAARFRFEEDSGDACQ